MHKFLSTLHNQFRAIKVKENIGKKENTIDMVIAGLLILLIGLFVAVRFDYYYDLNDDMLMKDIISGSYTGMPNGHNIQMLYPISWFLSLIYRIVRQISWYGLFFTICHFGCFYLIAVRSMQYVSKVYEKIAIAMVEGLLIFSFLLYEIVFIQYTVTAGLLGATAAFLLYTTDRKLTNKQFWKHNIVSIVLVILAFQVRSEMLLLISPMICVVGVCKWAEEDRIFAKESIRRYGIIIGALLAGVILSEGIHMMAYGSSDWRTFNALFDSRTELYDFQTIPAYDENEDFYQSIGLDKSEQVLFENYNYGIDAEINEKTMAEVAAYAKANRGVEQPVVQHLKESLKEYFHILFLDKSEILWNQLVIICYIAVAILAIYSYKIRKQNLQFVFWKLPFLFIVRSVLWFYIIYRGRIPNRISHTLYVTEVIILMAMLLQLSQMTKDKNIESEKTLKIEQKTTTHMRIVYIIATVILVGTALRYAPSGLQYVDNEYNRREAVNQEYLQLRAYCAANRDKVYFLDVYSSVAYSEKVFKDTDNTLQNYEYLGGWACMSPCSKDKLNALGVSSIEEGITSQSNVYVISHVKREIDWLTNYLKDKGYTQKPECIDRIGADGQQSFLVYRIAE